MSKLSAFLHPIKADLEKEVIISDRFVGEDGKPVPFKIRAITQELNDAIVRQCTRVEIKNGQRVEHLDSMELSRRMIVAATVEPDFTSKEMCDAYGVASPYLVPGKMLLWGEYARLSEAITDLSGLNAADTEADVKN